MRLDERVAQLYGLSRTKAAALIRGGSVYVNATMVTKLAATVGEHDDIRCETLPRFVSRGGEKLAAALAAFEIDVTGMRALDLGISTGGFSDCLLQAGAASVVGVDVGHAQTVQTLRDDPRLTLYEGINARYLRHELPQLAELSFDVITIDLSFISLGHVLGEVRAVLAANGHCVALLKPQFEVGRNRLGADGVVRDSSLHAEVLAQTKTLIEEAGLVLCASMKSPLLGTHGNLEYLLHAVRKPGIRDI